MNLDGYDIEGVLGHGAMGDVLLARQRRAGGRRVAIKRVTAAAPAHVAHLRREAMVLAALDHPNVVRLIDVVPDEAGVCLVMAYAAGGSVEQLARRRRLSQSETVAVVTAVADALASAHRRGVVHGDVKPSNILLTADGVPLLADFGVARLPGEQLRAGTPQYADPSGDQGATADVYALAVVAYELLTGRRPDGPPAPVGYMAPDVGPALATVIDRALAARPEDRYAGAEAFAMALRATSSPGVSAVNLGAQRGIQGVLGAGGASGEPVSDPNPTRVYGLRPPVPVEASAPREVPWAAVAALAVLLLSLPPAVTMLRPARADTGVPAVTAAPAPEGTAVARPADGPLRWCGHARPVPDTGGVLRGDLEGLGCDSWVRRRGDVVQAALRRPGGPQRFSVGRPGDQLLLGDWDCDGSDTLALYRPATGRVFRFNGWAQDDPTSSAPAIDSGVRDGRAHVRSDGECDEVHVIAPSSA
jgi:eukaryotic-like serine/threonine-protein kinase